MERSRAQTRRLLLETDSQVAIKREVFFETWKRDEKGIGREILATNYVVDAEAGNGVEGAFFDVI